MHWARLHLHHSSPWIPGILMLRLQRWEGRRPPRRGWQGLGNERQLGGIFFHHPGAESPSNPEWQRAEEGNSFWGLGRHFRQEFLLWDLGSRDSSLTLGNLIGQRGSRKQHTFDCVLPVVTSRPRLLHKSRCSLPPLLRNAHPIKPDRTVL